MSVGSVVNPRPRKPSDMQRAWGAGSPSGGGEAAPITFLEVKTHRARVLHRRGTVHRLLVRARAGCKEDGGQCRVGGQLAHPLEAYGTVETRELPTAAWTTRATKPSQ